MANQNQNRDEERKKQQAVPQGSHKEKSAENRAHEKAGEGDEGYMQGLGASIAPQDNLKKPRTPEKHPFSSMDKNEGEGKGQKI
jgi:hypothetical protein